MRTALIILLVGVAAICGLARPPGIEAKEEPKNRLPSDVLEALAEAEELAIMSVDPESVELVPRGGWKVLARQGIEAASDKEADDDKTDDEKAQDRKKIVAAMQKAVEAGGLMTKCFNPRHAIEADYNDHHYLLLICFECSQVVVYVDDLKRQTLAIGNSAKAVLDAALREAIARSKQPRPPSAGGLGS